MRSHLGFCLVLSALSRFCAGQNTSYAERNRIAWEAAAAGDLAHDAVPTDRMKALFSRAVMYARQRVWHDAERTSREAVALADRDPESKLILSPLLSNYAYVLRKMGRRRECAAVTRQLAALGAEPAAGIVDVSELRAAGIAEQGRATNGSRTIVGRDGVSEVRSAPRPEGKRDRDKPAHAKWAAGVVSAPRDDCRLERRVGGGSDRQEQVAGMVTGESQGSSTAFAVPASAILKIVPELTGRADRGAYREWMLARYQPRAWSRAYSPMLVLDDSPGKRSRNSRT